MHTTAFALISGLPPDSPNQRIMNDICSYPAADTVSIQINQGIYSGVLIGKNWILTAAHVAESAKKKPDTLKINIPCTKKQITAKKIIIHPAYHHEKAGNINLYDLALVELQQPIRGSIKPIAANFSLIPQGMIALLMGYGASSSPESQNLIGSKSNILRSGKNNLDGFVTNQKQQVAFIYDFDGPDNTTNIIGEGTLGNEIETEVAPGDSGSPVFGQNIKNEWSLIGISTFKMGFDNPTKQMPQPPAFGSGGGGILLNSSALWLLKLVPDLKIDWTPLQP